MDNSQKIPRLRNGKNRVGNYYFSFALDKQRTKFIAISFGKPLEHFLSFIVKASGNGFAIGVALWLFQFSISFTDDHFADKPVLQYGIFVKKSWVLYLPQRYVIWERK